MRNIIPKNAQLIPATAKQVFKGIIYDAYHWEQTMFDGSIQTFEMLKRPDSVKVIALKNNKIVVTRQRQPNTGVFYDIPGGMHDVPEEDELTAAKREVAEETGYTFYKWKLLMVEQPNKKIEQFIYVFLAWEIAEKKNQALEEGEKIQVELMDFIDFKKGLETEEFRSPKMDFLDNVHSFEDLKSIPEYK